MKHLSLIVSLLILPCSILAQTHKNYRSSKNIETLQSNTVTKNYKSLLIVGSGSMASRKFIHDIIYELDKQLADYAISYNYIYLGAEDAVINDNLKKSVLSGKYDAILMITPLRSTQQTIVYSNQSPPSTMRMPDGSVISAPANPYPYRVEDRLLEKVELQVRENLDSEPVWRGMLQTDIRQDAQKVFVGISRNLIAEMQENKLISDTKK
ncbi:MAG: hypothetical protein J7623_00345 [Chitinophaga sp.]|uniref:hypothetical protein n=1 Tax=Chitinophaga sp. TaxID=1869181 RepID=UPI001B2CA057|nr:hypothetical protein [Chitinophaga sp.]MBO9727063.1 hypothetical protein [Chitinophaga sp.]